MKPFIPADVPQDQHNTFAQNIAAITRSTGKLFLYACDQKIEHLNHDFVSPPAAPGTQHPEHLFKVAAQGEIGAMATHPGLLARYASSYPSVNYIAKLNGKTPLPEAQKDNPISAPLADISQIVQLRDNGIPIRGVGLTIYLGSDHENEMLSYAAATTASAHRHGLVTILWAYLRGPAISNEQDPDLTIGAAGLATALGYDFVKIKPPHKPGKCSGTCHLSQAVTAAGNTSIICSGQELRSPEAFLQALATQIHNGGTSGCATGRNVFQRALPDAVAMTHAISAIVYEGADYEHALSVYKGQQ